MSIASEDSKLGLVKDLPRGGIVKKKTTIKDLTEYD